MKNGPVDSALPAIALGIAFATAGLSQAEPAVNEEDLRPGLVATYRDAAKPAPVEIVQLDPTIALALKAGEAPHPRLAADGGSVRWTGYLKVLRPGPYRFRALLRGGLRVTVGGMEVLAAEGKDEAPVLKEGPESRLEAGVHPLVAEFTRLPGSARLELFWQAPHFRNEPLPYDHLGHLPKRVPVELVNHQRGEHGRYLAEERNCVACHRPADGDRIAKGLVSRQGPDLSKLGGRVHPGWVYRWLEAPEKVWPGAVMPRLFSADDSGRTERYAVARYLASLGGPVKSNAKQPKDIAASEARGRRLFNSIGCVACHQQRRGKAAPSSFIDPPSSFPLSGLGSKTIPEKLAAYLQDPLAIDRSGRMPHMLLDGKDAQDLARYLCASKEAGLDAELLAAPAKEQVVAAFRRVETRAEERAAFERLSGQAQFLDLGKRLVIEKGCNNCHTIAPGGKPFASVLADASFDDIRKKRQTGCLADDSEQHGPAAWFGFTADERRDLRLFLEDGASGAGSPAPAHAARVGLQRFNCLACHNRDGEGGLTPEVVESLRRFEKAENAEAVSPPTLTGVAHKLRTSSLRGVLTESVRVRQWMGLRMPQFGPANVGRLPEALAALEGAAAEDALHRVPLTAAKVEAGRHLAGKGAFGCISCHDLAGVPNTGTRGPDLALTTQRVRYDWFRRWLEQPQRMQPGTRMPSVFTEGKSLVNLLDGSADAQAQALWAYLSLGKGLPLPEGMEPPKGLILTVKDRPVLLRTFMPEAGSRAVAVGYPGGVALAFDAATCRLAYAWSGNFLDASPVWDNRGGSPARVLGATFWQAPPGCPWSVSSSNEPPDFASQAKDPAYGASLPEGQVYEGPRLLRFEGYTTDRSGSPTFRYRLHAEEPQPVEVTERPEPLHSTAGVGVARRFTLEVPAQQTVWLRAGECKREPRLLDLKGMAQAIDLKNGEVEVSTAGRLLVLPQDGDRAVVLALAAGPEGARWHLRQLGGTWQALLRLPGGGKVQADVHVWAPYRDEPGLMKDLIPRK